MTTTPADPLTPADVPFYIAAHVWDTENDAVARTITTIRSGVQPWDVIVSYAKELDAQGFADWHFQVRRDPDRAVLAKLDRTTWRDLPAALTDQEKYAAIKLGEPEGQPDPEGSHQAGATDAPEQDEIDLDAKLRDLLGTLLNVGVRFDRPLTPKDIDPDLLRVLKVEFNPKLQQATRYNDACQRFGAYTAYLAAAGGFSHLRENSVSHLMLVQILEELLDAARPLH